MKLALKWADAVIAEITQVNNIYITQVDTDNLIKAKKNGLMLGLMSQISVVSAELPKLILNRIPENRHMDIIEYISETECRYNTDKWSVEVIEK